MDGKNKKYDVLVRKRNVPCLHKGKTRICFWFIIWKMWGGSYNAHTLHAKLNMFCTGIFLINTQCEGRSSYMLGHLIFRQIQQVQ
jgi:hypothetical protein